jgi:hypothetical protein
MKKIKFEWNKYIVDGLFGGHPDLKVTSDEIILVDDSSYLGNFSQMYNDVVKNNNKIK